MSIEGFITWATPTPFQLTVINSEGRDDVSMPDSIAKNVERDFGKKVVDAFRLF